METKKMKMTSSICVVVPAYKVSTHIVKVVETLGPEVSKILVVDDACPESTGNYILEESIDPRLEVILQSMLN